MKLPTVILALAFAMLYSATGQSEEITFSALVGQWHNQKPHPSGATLSSYLNIGSDKSFYGTVSLDDKLVWTFDGTLELRGDQLTWHYVNSSRYIPPHVQDSDTIISIDVDSFTYKSGTSGEVGSYQRIK